MKTLVWTVAGMALCATLWWILEGSPSPRGSSGGLPAPSGGPATPAGPDSTALLEPVLTARSSASVEPAEDPTTADATREAVAPQATEPMAVRWVEGRVVFPHGTPADEQLFVVARPSKEAATG